jgi:ATP-dependent DNA helicase RecQ
MPSVVPGQHGARIRTGYHRHWGHDFRPDYRRLRTLIAELAPGLPVLATTATANARVTADVAEQLGTGTGPDGDGGRAALVLRGPLDRESLRLSCVALADSAHRLGWLAEQLPALPGSGIIYTLTVAGADETAVFLRGRGFEVAAYSGRTDDAERQQAEADLLANRIKALVATSALGMGFDKPDLGFVVHLGAPASPIAYYQQVGRAGRGVDRAEAVLLPGREDQAIWRYFSSLAFPPQASVERVLGVLDEARQRDPGRALSTMAIEPRVDLKRARLELLLKVLDADGAVRRVSGGWVSTGAAWNYDEERYTRITAAREAEQRAMLDYAATDRCRMEFLRRELDDPAAEPCGRCDNCTGVRYPTAVSETAVQAADAHSHRPGVAIEPRRQWPSGMPSVGVDLRGKIPAEQQAAPGRALARLTDLGWGTALRELFGAGAADRPVPPDMVGAVVEVLRDWSAEGWSGAGRPAGVVRIASRGRNKLGGSLAAQVAAIGRLPLLGVVDRIEDGASAGPSNSAWRLRSVHAAFGVGPELAAHLAETPGPVLLVDDLVDSGWTLTVVARLLRQSGASAVLPLTLAVSG